MRISFVEKETTMTTDKNNSCHPGASAFAKAIAEKSSPGFKIAARLHGEKEDVVFTLKSSVEPRLRWFSAAWQSRPPGIACKAGFCPIEMRPTRYLSAYKGFNAGSGSRILRKAQRTTIVQRVFSSNCSAVEPSHLKNAATVSNAR